MGPAGCRRYARAVSGNRADRGGALPAGGFSSWIRGVEAAIRDGAASRVPCEGCTACCRAHQFVPVAPDEADTLARVPEELLFPAPGGPPGHRVLPHDEQGHCPMLVADRCSIYEHRPRACRTYDCRIFAATGVDPGGGQEAVAARARRWRFTVGSEAERTERDACRRAGALLEDHPELWPNGPAAPHRLATGAVAVHDLFMSADEGSGRVEPREPGPEEVGAELARRSATRPTAPPPAGGEHPRGPAGGAWW